MTILNNLNKLLYAKSVERTPSTTCSIYSKISDKKSTHVTDRKSAYFGFFICLLIIERLRAGLLAQSAERGANNAKVVSSILTQAKSNRRVNFFSLMEFGNMKRELLVI